MSKLNLLLVLVPVLGAGCVIYATDPAPRHTTAPDAAAAAMLRDMPMIPGDDMTIRMTHDGKVMNACFTGTMSGKRGVKGCISAPAE